LVQAHLDEISVSARKIENIDWTIQALRSSTHTLGEQLVRRSPTWSRVVRKHGRGHTW